MTYGDACDIVLNEANGWGKYEINSDLAHDMVDDACYKADKYRWHDLRKNPEDLPREEGLYAVCLKYDTELSEIGFGQYENMYGYSCGWTATTPSFGKVIAWREIEPFEEEEE